MKYLIVFCIVALLSLSNHVQGVIVNCTPGGGVIYNGENYNCNPDGTVDLPVGPPIELPVPAPAPTPAFSPDVGEESPDGNCYYKVYKESKNWANARIDCQANGRRLAAIRTGKDGTWLANFLARQYGGSAPDRYHWLSGQAVNDAHTKWTWADQGIPLNFAGKGSFMWGATQPDGEGACVSFWSQTARLNDMPCGSGAHYVCERCV